MKVKVMTPEPQLPDVQITLTKFQAEALHDLLSTIVDHGYSNPSAAGPVNKVVRELWTVLYEANISRKSVEYGELWTDHKNPILKLGA